MWPQTITIVVPILVAIIGGVFYNGRQIDQLARLLGDRINDLRMDMRAGFASVDGRLAPVDARFASFAGIETELRELRALLHDALRPRAS